MTIDCPFCNATYRVDPDKISPSGVRTTCTQCDGMFGVRESGETVPLEAAVAGAAGESYDADERAASESVSPPESTERDEPGAGSPAAEHDSTIAPDAWGETTTGAAAPGDTRAEPEDSPSAAEAAGGLEAGGEPASPAESAPTPERPIFGRQDPDTRANRIARALVSDIVAYHGDKLEGAREAGTLKSEFREEIVKSWEEYAEQVGEEFAKETPYFKNALNEILAQGKTVF